MGDAYDDMEATRRLSDRERIAVLTAERDRWRARAERAELVLGQVGGDTRDRVEAEADVLTAVRAVLPERHSCRWYDGIGGSVHDWEGNLVVAVTQRSRDGRIVWETERQSGVAVTPVDAFTAGIAAVEGARCRG